MANIAFIVGSPSSPSSTRDAPIKTLLEGAGHTVTYVDDSDTPAAGSYDMFVISESASDSNATDWHNDVDIPVLTLEVSIRDQGYGSGHSTSGAGDETGKVNVAHYITDDYSINDEFEYCDAGDDRGYVTGWSNDVKALVVVANNTSRALILSIEDGDTDANSGTAINRRAMFVHPRAGEWTTDGEDIFKRCIDWCLGLDSGGDITITSTVANVSASGLNGTLAPGGSATLDSSVANVQATALAGGLSSTGNASIDSGVGNVPAAGLDGSLVASGTANVASNAGEVAADGLDGVLSPTGAPNIVSSAADVAAGGLDGSLAANGTANIPSNVGEVSAEALNAVLSAAGIASLISDAGNVAVTALDGTIVIETEPVTITSTVADVAANAVNAHLTASGAAVVAANVAEAAAEALNGHLSASGGAVITASIANVTVEALTGTAGNIEKFYGVINPPREYLKSTLSARGKLTITIKARPLLDTELNSRAQLNSTLQAKEKLSTRLSAKDAE